jgi:hypothetical protein
MATKKLSLREKQLNFEKDRSLIKEWSFRSCKIEIGKMRMSIIKREFFRNVYSFIIQNYFG